MYDFMVKINIVRVELADVLAKTKTVCTTCEVFLLAVLVTFAQLYVCNGICDRDFKAET